MSLPTYAEVKARGERLQLAADWVQHTRRILGDASDIEQPKPFSLGTIAAVVWDHVSRERGANAAVWSSNAFEKYLR